MRVESFGTLPDGQPVDKFSIRRPDASLEAISFGGIITSLEVPDRSGQLGDVVLGLPTLADYVAGHPWFGAITGRVAGRITAGRLPIDDRVIQLEINDPPNHLHGGSAALDKQVWQGRLGESEAGPHIEFSHTSPDGACGYPGTVTIAVRYTLLEGPVLRIEYDATTDKLTPLSLTNHTYFNLAGEGSGTVNDHLLEIFSDSVVRADAAGTLSGELTPVEGTPDDFRTPRRLGDAIPLLAHLHGENYRLPRASENNLTRAACVTEPHTGRCMEVLTTEPCMQFYTGRHLDKSPWRGKSGRLYEPYSGLCLECHGYPDAPNQPHLGDIMIRPGTPYRQVTEYRFRAA